MGNISKLTPILYDKGETNFNHNGLGKLTKLLVNEIDEVLNGELEAFFEYPANGHLADEIDNEMFIKAKPNKKDEPHVFKIYDYELDTFTQTYLIYARSKNIEDLRNNVILNANVKDLAPTQAWNLAKNNALDPVVTTFYSDITTTSSVHWERRSLLSTIAGQEGSMIQYWGGEIKHDINRISLLRRRGQDNVTTVRHGKNLDGLKATYSTKGLVTAIVPYYVKSDDKSIYGNVVKSQYINNYPSTYYDIIEYNDEALGLTQEDEPEGGWEDSTIRTELNRVAKRYFDENVGKDLPSINMEISLEDISQTKEYENFKDFEQIEIGDTITVYSKKFGLNINAKVRRVVYNGLTDKNELVEVGTARRSLYDDVRDEFKKVEIELKEGIDHAMASADGKNTIYHGTADPNEVGLVGKNNDTYFRANGQFKEIWSYLDGQWHLEVGDLTGEQIKADIAEQQQAIEEAKKTADEAVDRINTDIAGKFTALDEEILAIEGISNSAQANAQMALTQSIDALGDASLALTNAQTAINTAGSAISSIQDINVEVDKINGTLAVKADSSTVNALDGTVSNLSTEVGIIAGELSLKANSSTVDTLTGRVSTAESGITANANAINLKANQSTVDTLAGTVSSLGTDIGVVAGQISSKVWNTDIQTAVDRIEVGGRNYLPLSKGDLKSYGPFNTNWKISDETIETVINRENHILNLTLSYDSLSEPIATNEVVTFSGFLKVNNEIPEKHPFVDNRLSTFVGSSQTEFEYNKDTGYFKSTYLKRGGWIIHAQTTLVKGDKISIYKPKIEKGNKATDWTPAPEDTTALINHVESELTQKYDSITAAVSSVDGRVAQQKLTLDGLTTTIQDVRKDLTGTTTLLNTTRTTVSGHTSTIATLRTDVDGKATITQFNTLNSTVNGTVTRVGNAEGKITTIESNVSGLQTTVADKADQSQVTQLSNLIDARVTTDEMENAISISEQGILAQTVLEGEVVARINQEAGTTLIQNNRIYLAAETVAFSGEAIIPSAAIQELTADKITTGTFDAAKARIINLDFNTAVGNATEFVTSRWNANSSDVRITGVGLQTVNTTGDYSRVVAGELRSYNYANDASAIMGKGRSQYYIDGTSRVIMGRTLHGNSWANEATIQVAHSRRFAIGRYNAITSDSQASFWAYMGLEYGIQGNEGSGYVAFYKRAEFENITTFTSEVRIRSGTNSSQIKQEGGALRHYANTSYSWNLGGYRVLTIERSGTNNYTSMYAHLNMQGYTITNAANISDERMKDVHGLRDENDLDKLMNIQYVDFTWNDSNLGGRDFGFIAQQVQNIVPEMMMDVAGGYLGFNQQTYTNLIGHAVQQLAVKEENTNKIASQALQATETNAQKIKRLEKRIEELESAA